MMGQNWLSKLIKVSIFMLFIIIAALLTSAATFVYNNLYYNLSEDTNFFGMEWDGTYFLAMASGSILYQYYSNWTYTGISYDLSSEDSTMRDVAWDGNYYHAIGDTNNRVYIYNSTWDFTGNDYLLDDTGPVQIHFDGTYFWILDRSGADHVDKYDFNWNFISSFPMDEDINPLGFSIDPGNYFWIQGGSSKRTYQYYWNGTYTGENFPHTAEGWGTIPHGSEMQPQGTFWMILGSTTYGWDTVYQFTSELIVDSCTPPGSGDWKIINGDVCTLNTAKTITGYLNISDGSLQIQASGDLTMSGSNRYIFIYPGSNLTILSGGTVHG